jgi:hypothetical protein
MMGAGFGWLMTLNTILLLFGVWGFAYIIWTMASKESGNLKMIGQVIAGVIAVMIVAILIYGLSFGSQMRSSMRSGMMGGSMMGCPMMGSGMTKGKDGGKMMTPERQKMMKEKMEHKGMERK